MPNAREKLGAYLNSLAKEAAAIQIRLYSLECCIREIAEKLESSKPAEEGTNGYER